MPSPNARRLAYAWTTAASLVASPSFAKEITVGVAGSDCRHPDYATIQGAIDAAAPHDTIQVCPGTYREQVAIPAGKDGLTLRSRKRHAAVIEAPAVMSDPGDVVRISTSRDVTFEGFKVAGPLPDALFCSGTFTRVGIAVDGGASATIRGNHVTQMRSASDALRGCQNGTAIQVGTRASDVGEARIEDNVIDSFQKSGIVVEHAGSRAIVAYNRVTGDGPSTVIAQNGIDVNFGADGVVEGNRVKGESYTPSPIASGILFYQPGRVRAVGNLVEKADLGIAVVDGAGVEIEENVVVDSPGIGIDLDEVDTGTTGARVERNVARGSGDDSFFASALSAGNRIRENAFLHGSHLDAEDQSSGSGTAGTGNSWEKNLCKTDNKGGALCAAR